MYLIIHYDPFSYFFAFQIEILGTFMPNWEQFYAEREQKIFILLVQEPFWASEITFTNNVPKPIQLSIFVPASP